MHTRRPWLALLLCVGALAAAESGIKAEYIGGTLEIPAKSKVTVDLTGTDKLILRSGSRAIEAPFAKVRTLEYGQTVGRRYAEAIIISPLFLLSKSRKHFVTIGYEDAQLRPQAIVLRVDKGDIRPFLASLEARTGRRIEYQDNESRKGTK
jgi:hypothetical protein